MDRLERIDSPQDALRVAMAGAQGSIWTTLPGIIQSFNKLAMTVTVQPAIQMQLTDAKTNKVSWMSLPLLVDVPLMLASSGGMSVTMPVALGDECLVSFAARCIDSWWKAGGVQHQHEFRMHDLSDGFAFIGPRSQPRVLASYSDTTMQIRSDDGSVVIDINPTTHGISISAPGNLSITAPTTTINGNLAVIGNTTHTGQISANGKRIDDSHKHSGVQSGASQTGVPV
jgi:hypothetical protein